MGQNSTSARCASGYCEAPSADTSAQPLIEAGRGVISDVAARFDRILSLLIMIGADSTSRSSRPMVNSVSLRYPDRPQARSELNTVVTASSDTCTLVNVIVA